MDFQIIIIVIINIQMKKKKVEELHWNYQSIRVRALRFYLK